MKKQKSKVKKLTALQKAKREVEFLSEKLALERKNAKQINWELNNFRIKEENKASMEFYKNQTQHIIELNSLLGKLGMDMNVRLKEPNHIFITKI